MVTIAAFEHEQNARDAARGWGVMGVGDGETNPLLVYDSYYEYKQEKDQERRNIALAKLTRADKEILGIK